MNTNITPRPTARIWPFGGGKGGSGKSFLAASIASNLAKAGKKTLMIDADLGAANLHTVMGISYPDTSLSDFVNKRVKTLEDTVVETGQPNLFLISGAKDTLEIANLLYSQKLRLLRAIHGLPYEYIILDLGGGTSFNILDFFMISKSGFFITTPEPTSIENTYRFIRSVYIRKIKQACRQQKLRPFLGKATNWHAQCPFDVPSAIVDMVNEEEPEKGKALERSLQALQFKLVINQFRKQDSAGLGNEICRVCEKHLGLRMTFLGNVSFDDRVHDAVCMKISFVDKYPYTRTASDLRAISHEILSLKQERPTVQPRSLHASAT